MMKILNETSFDEEMAFVLKFKLSFEEFNILKLLLLAVNPESERSEYLKQYLVECQKGSFQKKYLLKFEELGFIEPLDYTNLDLSKITFKKSFLKEWYCYFHVLGKNLMEVFPLYSNGYCVKNITKSGYHNENDFYLMYSKKIKNSVNTHKKIIALLKYAITNNLIQYNIVDFVLTERWKDLEKLQQEGYTLDNVVVNTMKDA